jgi:hypothetical protein
MRIVVAEDSVLFREGLVRLLRVRRDMMWWQLSATRRR